MTYQCECESGVDNVVAASKRPQGRRRQAHQREGRRQTRRWALPITHAGTLENERCTAWFRLSMLRTPISLKCRRCEFAPSSLARAPHHYILFVRARHSPSRRAPHVPRAVRITRCTHATQRPARTTHSHPSRKTAHACSHACCRRMMLHQNSHAARIVRQQGSQMRCEML